MRFRNVCVTVESWKALGLSRGQYCESHWALRVPGAGKEIRGLCCQETHGLLIYKRPSSFIFPLSSSSLFPFPSFLTLPLSLFLLLINSARLPSSHSKNKVCSLRKVTTQGGPCSRIKLELEIWGTALAVQRLRLFRSHCWGTGLIPGEIP